MSPPDVGLDGQVEPIGQGRSFWREVAYPLPAMHGSRPLHGVRTLGSAALAIAARDPEIAYVDLSRAVFLDTETTGLGLGVGTYVFLIGAGYLDGDAFKVRQYFLGAPGEERLLLAALADFLAPFPALVTFNGKAFDWPLLESRFLFNRRRPPLVDPPHLDLLHPARRLWKRRLESCALQALEREILGVWRTAEDVPGWLIPQLYFDYLRHDDGERLRGVFYHNLHDILSLAVLTVHVERVVSDPLGGETAHGLDFSSLGRLFDKAGNAEWAVECLEEALRHELPREERDACLFLLGGVYKRQRWWDGALRVWERCVECGGEVALLALVELAKYHEHVEREYLTALDAVQQAIVLAELRPDVGVDRGELEHRRARLLNRVYRNRSWVRGGGGTRR